MFALKGMIVKPLLLTEISSRLVRPCDQNIPAKVGEARSASYALVQWRSQPTNFGGKNVWF